MSGIDSIPGGAERVAKALDYASTMFGALGQEARIAIFEAVNAEPDTDAALQKWQVARRKVVHHKAETSTDRTLWQVVNAYLAKGGRAIPPTVAPAPEIIVAAIENAALFRPGTEVIGRG
jgi:hypothetical protein